MLRIHFSDRDLARVRVAPGVDPLWETLLAAHQFAAPPRSQRGPACWRARAGTEIAGLCTERAIRALLLLAPPRAGYFPDFLTPGGGREGLHAGLDALRGTPRWRLEAELARTFRRRPVPGWCRELARGDREVLTELAAGLAGLHAAVIAPDWSGAAALVEQDRALRARALRDGGVHGLLASLGPAVRWEPPVLSVTYPEHREVRLDGRGLCLVPSRFCWRVPVALADPGLPQVLVYPAVGDAPGAGAGRRDGAALSALLGRTRACVLAALDGAATTGELAVRLAVSAATASGHVTALREAGLVLSHRSGNRVMHSLSPLGDALLRGGTPPAARPAGPHRVRRGGPAVRPSGAAS